LESCGNLTQHAPLNANSPTLFPHDLPFGDEIHHIKDENIFWVGYCNIGGFPATPMPNNKAQERKTFMALY